MKITPITPAYKAKDYKHSDSKEIAKETAIRYISVDKFKVRGNKIDIEV